MDDSLNNIPNLGPSRRTALEAAGITSRAAVARMTVDQLVSAVGIPRVTAEKVLTFLQEHTPETLPEPASLLPSRFLPGR